MALVTMVIIDLFCCSQTSDDIDDNGDDDNYDYDYDDEPLWLLSK